jgi:hypothetical protein
MELAIPLVALGGMYLISNQSKGVKKDKDKENFNNMGIRTKYTGTTSKLSYYE